MTEKNPKTKKSKFQRFSLITLVGMVCVLVLGFVYLTFMPTGYGEFEARQATALERVEAALETPASRSEEMPSAKPADSPTAEAALSSPTLTNPRRVQLLKGLRNLPQLLGMGEKMRVGLRFASDNVYQTGAYGVLRSTRGSTSEEIDKLLEGVKNGFRWKDRGPWNLPRETLRINLETLVGKWGETLKLYDLGAQKPPGKSLSFYDTPPPSSLIHPSLRPYLNSKHFWSARVLLSTLSQNDPLESAEMLERYFDKLRDHHLRYFPDKSAQPFRQALGLIALLGQMEAFPEEGFARARAVLEKARLNPEQERDFRVAHVMRERERFDLLFSESKLMHKGNTFHYLMDGLPERTISRVFLPAMNRQIDCYTLALAQGSDAEIIASYKKLFLVGKTLNLQETRTGDDRKSFWTQDHYSGHVNFTWASNSSRLAYWKGEGFNQEVDWALVFLAVSHFRHERGRFPEKFEELTPKYLSPALASSPDVVWEVRTLERFSTPLIYHSPSYYDEDVEAWFDNGAPTTDAFSQAVEQYHAKQGRFPTMGEELRRYASNDAQFEAFEERFSLIESRPVIICVRKRKPLKRGNLSWTTGLKYRKVSNAPTFDIEARWPKVILTPISEDK